MTRHRITRLCALLSGLAAAATLAAVAPVAVASSKGTYLRADLFPGKTPAYPAPVPGSDSLRALERASLLVPGTWHPLPHSSPRALRFIGGLPECRFHITLTQRVVQSTDGSAADRLASSMPHADALLDDGIRRAAAWRVILHKKSPADTVIAERTQKVSTAPDKLPPAGQAVWHELRARATEPPGGECHSGSYRDLVGPQLGDVMATARIKAGAF